MPIIWFGDMATVQGSSVEGGVVGAGVVGAGVVGAGVAQSSTKISSSHTFKLTPISDTVIVTYSPNTIWLRE